MTTSWSLTEDEMDDGASLVDPNGVGPKVGFLKVPEAKQVKNRLHLDLQVSGGRHLDRGLRRGRIRGMVERLVAAGGISRPVARRWASQAAPSIFSHSASSRSSVTTSARESGSASAASSTARPRVTSQPRK